VLFDYSIPPLPDAAAPPPLPPSATHLEPRLFMLRTRVSVLAPLQKDANHQQEWLTTPLSSMANGSNEPLPGLLDDPQFQTDLPWTDFQIAPLRDPAPQRNANVPSPLEPEAGGVSQNGPRAARSEQQAGPLKPSDFLRQAREPRKPHLAISELVDDNDSIGGSSQQLPSFVSLSVVEKSPTQTPQALGGSNYGHLAKRPRLDQDPEMANHDLGRQLPRPNQREQNVLRPTPLLPAMVTGLHEPPPSAALLPSMDPDRRHGLPQRSATTSKIQVKDILSESRSPSPSPSFQRQLPVPHMRGHPNRSLPHLDFSAQRPNAVPTPPSSAATPISATIPLVSREGKQRRTRRKWSEEETRHLLAGVKKHGVGKWKQILNDSNLTFSDRSAVDLKDRYRVVSKDGSDRGLTPVLRRSTPTPTPGTTSADNSGPNTPVQTPPPPPPPSFPVKSTSLPIHPNPSIASSSPSPKDVATIATGPATSASGATAPRARRKRRAWTDTEDDALLRGVQKHGFQWTLIHDDESLQLQHRRATDLRDRIRNKFPDGYRQAEVKPLRSEVKKAEKEKGKARERGVGDGGQQGRPVSRTGGNVEEDDEDAISSEDEVGVSVS
jgi:hypothetical protein